VSSHHYGSPPGSPTASTTGLHSVGSLDSFAHGDAAGTALLFVILYVFCWLQVCWERDHLMFHTTHVTAQCRFLVCCVCCLLLSCCTVPCYLQAGSA
jgi:hypothetical protein